MKRLFLIGLIILGFGHVVMATPEQQAQGIIRFNRCLSEMLASCRADNIDESVNKYLEFVPPTLGSESKKSWKKHLENFSQIISDRKVESIELVAVERLSTKAYIYRYILHGQDGPLLFVAKSYSYQGKWLSCGFSFKTDVDDISEDFKDRIMLEEPIVVGVTK